MGYGRDHVLPHAHEIRDITALSDTLLPKPVSGRLQMAGGCG